MGLPGVPTDRPMGFPSFPTEKPMEHLRRRWPKALMDALLKTHGRHRPRELEHGRHGGHLGRLGW